MKAVIFHQHGGPEVLQYTDCPTAEPGPGEVLIRIRAIGMNFNDIWARAGMPGMKIKFPHMPGSEVAGEVAALGAGVADMNVGDRVLVYPGLGCKRCRFCATGQESMCPSFRVWGFQTGPLDGGYAEYARVPADTIVPLPAGLSFEEGAATTVGLLTSWHMLVTGAQIKPGDVVLVWGVTSGIGVYACQIAKLFNARVIGVAGSDEKLEVARRLGADHLVNYNTQNVFREVRKLTDRQGVDVVFEHTGMSTWQTSIQCMAYGARLVTCGNTTGFEAKLDLRVLYWRHLKLIGCHASSKGELVTALQFVENGQIKPVVGRVFALRDAAEAHAVFEDGRKAGKIILTP